MPPSPRKTDRLGRKKSNPTTGDTAMTHLDRLFRHSARKNLIAAAAMAAFVGLSSAAIADQISGEMRAKKVSLVDIDLSTVDGQRAARERLHQAARHLCSEVADDLDLSHRANYLACVDIAMAKAERLLQAMASRSGADLLARK
jgi:UrcA family protein